ncbi:MAG: arsenate reductase (glutaredoxin) [Brevundimonas subvibrioides]|uniref:Arsenate reductase n=1 Tax=Brevundimonas subvibrioides TaxID=74313 RepID=A0A258HPZ8_9CAUL|nr:arsenate reductase (glutaredoxin) [Brevundimonas subvibrioides]OYX59085.1 MAG: arsenate reductase (glutaredoxin) [Brevundimonas subvibrioides]
MTDFPVTIFHNPDCGTSRNVLAAVEAQGYAPKVVLYLESGWTALQLTDLVVRMGVPVRAVLREKGTPAETLGLLDPAVSDETLISAMVEHPILVNRPIVETPLGVVMARPSERVFEVLDRRPETFVKEDGEVVVL